MELFYTVMLHRTNTMFFITGITNCGGGEVLVLVEVKLVESSPCHGLPGATTTLICSQSSLSSSPSLMAPTRCQENPDSELRNVTDMADISV